MENKTRENNLKYLRELHEEFKKNPTSTLIYYQITNLEKKLGITLKVPIRVNGLSGTFSYEPDPVMLKHGGYPGMAEDDFIEDDVLKKIYTKI